MDNKQQGRMRKLHWLLACLPLLNGCASLAEGVTSAFMRSGADKPDTRKCDVVGPGFPGLAPFLGEATDNAPRILKLLKIHGIGEQQVGYSTRLQRNLASALGLARMDEHSRKIGLRSTAFPGRPLGQLQVWRYQSKDGLRQLLFYELTWSDITQGAKQALAYDTSGAYSYRRAELNAALKSFVNSHVADPAMYRSDAGQRIIESAAQSLCWMLRYDWSGLPSRKAQVCDKLAPPLARSNEKLAVITHSLGSRIIMDALQSEVQHGKALLDTLPAGGKRDNLRATQRYLQNTSLDVFMLANQLPLLQLGVKPPEEANQYNAFCSPGGARYRRRLLGKLRLVAFSDPNDLLSYAIPPDYANNYLDSRLCSEVINVHINIAEVIDLFGFGTLADPVTAHGEYENDERVIDLIARGIGQAGTGAAHNHCDWLETVNP